MSRVSIIIPSQISYKQTAHTKCHFVPNRKSCLKRKRMRKCKGKKFYFVKLGIYLKYFENTTNIQAYIGLPQNKLLNKCYFKRRKKGTHDKRIRQYRKA